ncbi:Striatin-4 [Turdus rufiventris]|nr:Striatin-4 [Turdus rufiventris]
MAAERAPPARAQPPPSPPAPGAAAAAAEPPARTGLSLPGILHFIQHEWARFEAEKGRWEAERAELQVPDGPVSPKRSWSPRLTLRSHYDAVRALAFVPCHPALVTASEDATLKLWNLQKPLVPKKSAALDVEPVYAFRGHRGPVLAVAVAAGDSGDSGASGGSGLCCSAGVDARIRCWRLPALDSDPYDGYGGSGQVNQVVTHPSQPLTITASDDRGIRYLDNRTGKVVHSMVAHLDAVTCLALDPSGAFLLSGSE